MVRKELDAELVELLARAEHGVTSRLTTVLSGAGSSVDEWRILSLLQRTGGRSMSAIAAAAMLPAPTLTKRIDRMVADNLVLRRVDEQDRRRVLVALAPRGRALHHRLAPLVRREEQHLASVVAEVTDVAEVLRALSALARVDLVQEVAG